MQVKLEITQKELDTLFYASQVVDGMVSQAIAARSMLIGIDGEIRDDETFKNLEEGIIQISHALEISRNCFNKINRNYTIGKYHLVD